MEATDPWQRLIQAGEIRLDQLRPAIGRSWKRSLALGCNPLRMPCQRLPDAETRALLRGEDILLQVASDHMQWLKQQVGTTRHAFMLGDERGYVLQVVGDQQSVDGPDRVPGPGALISEATCGTNGLATALAEAAPVRVHHGEHYFRPFQTYSCVGAPIAAPDGALTGVLCLAAPDDDTADRMEALVLSAARAIEAELLALQLERAPHGEDDELLRLYEEINDVISLLKASDRQFVGAPVHLNCAHDIVVLADRKRLRRRLMAQLSRLRGKVLCPYAVSRVTVAKHPHHDFVTVQMSIALGSDPDDFSVLEEFQLEWIKGATTRQSS